MERIHNRALEIVLGLALSAVMALGVVIIWESFKGAFSSDISVSAELAKAGDALEQGDIVTYRNVIVGEVTESTGNAAGGAVAKLKIHPNDADVIPANVTAVAVPASLFGNTKIELLPPAHPAGHLKAGQAIAADLSPTAASLQTALANAYDLLTSVHPAQLDAALSALATALQGQGQNINTLIAKADAYLSRLAPHLPELNDVITSFATVTRQLARNAPDLMTSLSNVLVLAKGILHDKQVVAELLSIAPGVVGHAQQLLNRNTVDHAVTIVSNEVPVSAALAANPDALINTLAGFHAFANTFNETLAKGPFLRANILLTGADFTRLAAAAAGGKGTVFHEIVNPKEYTLADCPRYDGASGPNCPSAASAQVFGTGLTYGGTSSSVGSADEQRALRAAASLLTRLPVSQLSSGVVDVLLGPLLRGVPTIVQATK